ncbi:MAG: elongation factor P 5-aminopentanone reductase [Candidatus Ornithomonoglobus sp.]
MKNVLITGGSRGIGAECVRVFSDAGYRVFFTYKHSDKIAQELAQSTCAVAVKCDASSFKDTEAAASLIHKTGSIDIIINNAGISQIKMFQDITEEDWDNMFDVNVKGMFVTSKVFLDDMLRKKSGRIINISSMWGEDGGSCEVHYSASKAAVIGFTKALAKELGPSGITVNCISPGVINTEMNSYLSQEDINELIYETPLERIGAASDVANTALFLASEAAGFITGADIPVNGGIIM